MSNGAGASAAIRNVVNRIAAFFRIKAVHTRYPSEDIETMLVLVRQKARTAAGIEEGEIERLQKTLSSASRDVKRLIREKLLSDQSAALHFRENEQLKAENKELRIRLRASGGHAPDRGTTR